MPDVEKGAGRLPYRVPESAAQGTLIRYQPPPPHTLCQPFHFDANRNLFMIESSVQFRIVPTDVAPLPSYVAP